MTFQRVHRPFAGSSPVQQKAAPFAPRPFADRTVQRKIGVEIEVGSSAFELRSNDPDEAKDLTQSQTVATRDAGGKNVEMKAEGPRERRALAEFVTKPYTQAEKAGFLTAVGLLATQAQTITENTALGGWTIQGGDRVNILQWPVDPQGGFQFTVSPVDNTVVHLYNAFPANKVTSYSAAEGLTQEDPEDLAVATKIQELRVLAARNADLRFWHRFRQSGLAVVDLPGESPGELFNVIVGLAEALTWRLGLLLKELGSTFKNSLDLMPKFDFGVLLDKQLRLFVGDTDFEEKSAVVRSMLIDSFYEALKEQEGPLLEEITEKLKERRGQSVQILGYLEQLLEPTEPDSLASDFVDRRKYENDAKAARREIAVYDSLLTRGLATTIQDVIDVLTGKKLFLGDITLDDSPSVMEDEGSLIPPDANSPEGAFEHRNPFNSKVAAANWVDATTQFLALLEEKGVRY